MMREGFSCRKWESKCALREVGVEVEVEGFLMDWTASRI